MLILIIIIALLLIGLGLVVIELIFIPGTTIVGILGLVFAIAGIVISYRVYGSETGFYVLIGSSVLTVATLVYSIRSGAWSKFSLKSAINSRVNDDIVNDLKVGDTGITRSRLRPVGKAEFNNREYEVKTLGVYLESNQPVKIVQILSHQIIVEPTNS